jgi:hypothetical protein
MSTPARQLRMEFIELARHASTLPPPLNGHRFERPSLEAGTPAEPIDRRNALRFGVFQASPSPPERKA